MLWPLSGLGIETFPTWAVVLILAVEIGIRLAVLGIIPENRRPQTAMAWLIAIFFIPAVALPLFLLIGSAKLSARRQRRQARINEEVLRATRGMDLSDQLRDLDEQLGATAALNRNLGAFPVQDGNRVELISGYEDYFDQMAAEIDGAEQYVHMLFYIIAEDPVAAKVLAALERAAARGVTVRLLYDHVGSMRTNGYRKLVRRLRAAEKEWPDCFQWRRALPIRPFRLRFSRPDLRNHRKIVVVDGRTAFTGSANLIESHYKRRSAQRMGRHWVELNAKITGPAVTGLDIVFATDWYAETDENPALTRHGHPMMVDIEADEATRGGSLAQVVPSGPGFPDENNLRLFNDLIYQATERLVICTPYLVPDDSLLYALTNASYRDVDVVVLVTEKADQFLVQHAQQSYYQALLEAGVRIFRYPAPDVLHSKFMVVDQDTAVLGSSNMDMRSFTLNLEVTLMVVDDEKIAEFDAVLAEYFRISSEVSADAWASRSWGTRYLDNVSRLTAALQ
ncbi:cardiolipin synthase [Nesterenkonia populi]|uniref:cardiolipin synthase n=1 Tax=Nesterenkonia populi TaxID=1591087 RepID=UPI0011BE65A8|nr:cardiolipin synthase [Nesterenkonia populi]